MVDLGVTGPPRFPQKVTFTGELVIDTEGMDWEAAVQNVSQALLDGDGGAVEYTLNLVKVTRMEIVEDE
jgi:hypothetical protein